MKKTTKTLIISIASVAILTGAFLGVYFLLPDQSDTSADSDITAAHSDGEEHTHEEYSLISHVPADIKQIDVKNEKGEYTLLSRTPVSTVTNAEGESSQVTDSTIYTLVGYEDKELLQGSPDMVASDAAAVTAGKIVNDGTAKSDFGFDEPRSVVKVEFTNGDKATITVGDDAPDNQGTYLTVNDDKNIYLVTTDSADGFLIGAMNMMSTNIGKSADDDSENVFTKMILGGEHYGVDVEFGYADSDKYSSTYMITSPDRLVADEENVTYMLNNIRSLTAEEVMTVDPDEAAVKEYGLDIPYVTVNAEYPDLTVDYKASKPSPEGEFYLLTNGIIYKLKTDSAPWILNDYSSCISKKILDPKLESLSSIEITGGGASCRFDVKTETAAAQEDSEQTETVTTVKRNGAEVNKSDFDSFYSELTDAQRTGGVTEKPSSGESILKVEYTFTDGSKATAEYFTAENRKCPVLINGTVTLTAYESYVTKMIEQIKSLSEQ